MTLALLTACSSNTTMTEDATTSVTAESTQNSPSSDSVQAETTAESSIQEATESEKLGTKWGDEVESNLTLVDLRRVDDEPVDEMQVYYADKTYQGRALNSRSLVAGKVDFSVATDAGQSSLYRDNGQYYLQGKVGQAYQLVYKNNSANTYEVVASVDGINVFDGSAASRYDNGYVLSPNEELVIEGFRKSQNAVASFIFSQPERAYAANTDSGSIENTGVIGTVIYELYDPNQPKPKRQRAFPADDNGFAKPPK